MNKRVNPADPSTIPKFTEPLSKPPVAKPVHHCDYPDGSYYELEMREACHRFHRLFPQTRIWGYNGLLPGPTFEARKDRTLYVKYLNHLPDQHFLPLDRTLHSSFDTADVRTVVHLHGANVAWESDGHPEAWYTKGYKETGPKFTREVHEYTNHQSGTTLWYHDHAMSLTRLNVYAGLAGFYLLRDALEDRLALPSGKYEFPLMIQDRTFNEDGSLFYPDSPPFPVTVHPSITPGVTGNTITVNGKVWPYLSVEPRKYRFRILNASNRRGYALSLSNGSPFHQIGTDGGFLAAPEELDTVELLPAERTDLIIDFSGMEGQQITLLNSDTEFQLDEHTGVVMQFRVDRPMTGEDTSRIPETMRPDMAMHESHAHIIRDLPLTADTDEYGRPMLMLNDRMYHDPATEKPSLDSIERWNFFNLTPIQHPIHVHLVQFKILGRRPFDTELFEQGILRWTGPFEPPRDYERGWKDVVKADVGKMTSIIMHFKEHTGHYIWHCHFLEHEDHDMMRPITIIGDAHPVQLPHAGESHPEPPDDSRDTEGSAQEAADREEAGPAPAGLAEKAATRGSAGPVRQEAFEKLAPEKVLCGKPPAEEGPAAAQEPAAVSDDPILQAAAAPARKRRRRRKKKP
ncbi:multicopper oxidase family protein [Edaphobacillus lindanitolerans]|uniref:Spore coat protein A n=1 Tax=Edaphobacillus lindanitolerans TaxID=550447 RepID=A0A1U7PJ39_9BACI|nr:multicopper oxidase [Edaphobacillus lindanitolerans]SIT67656.1 spore coat protein A [Edaphobacillus lindanitolerans]